MVSAVFMSEGRSLMNDYPVHVALTINGQAMDNQSAELEALMEALADIDSADPMLLDWTVGFDGAVDLIEIDLTIRAKNQTDALAHGHLVVQSAASDVESHLGKASLFMDSKADFRVYS